MRAVRPPPIPSTAPTCRSLHLSPLAQGYRIFSCLATVILALMKEAGKIKMTPERANLAERIRKALNRDWCIAAEPRINAIQDKLGQALR